MNTEWFDRLPIWLQEALANAAMHCTLWELHHTWDVFVFRPWPRFGMTARQVIIHIPPRRRRRRSSTFKRLGQS